MVLNLARRRLVELVIGRIGATQTALWLDVDREVLDGWVSGTRGMPDDKLLALLDLADRAYKH
jgi:hypothetical protein